MISPKLAKSGIKYRWKKKCFVCHYCPDMFSVYFCHTRFTMVCFFLREMCTKHNKVFNALSACIYGWCRHHHELFQVVQYLWSRNARNDVCVYVIWSSFYYRNKKLSIEQFLLTLSGEQKIEKKKWQTRISMLLG